MINNDRSFASAMSLYNIISRLMDHDDVRHGSLKPKGQILKNRSRAFYTHAPRHRAYIIAKADKLSRRRVLLLRPKERTSGECNREMTRMRHIIYDSRPIEKPIAILPHGSQIVSRLSIFVSHEESRFVLRNSNAYTSGSSLPVNIYDFLFHFICTLPYVSYTFDCYCGNKFTRIPAPLYIIPVDRIQHMLATR